MFLGCKKSTGTIRVTTFEGLSLPNKSLKADVSSETAWDPRHRSNRRVSSNGVHGFAVSPHVISTGTEQFPGGNEPCLKIPDKMEEII